MTRLGRVLAPGGLAVVSCWQFAHRERFRRRAVESPRVDPAELEKGDYLLRWGDGAEVRYCHHIDDVEAAELAAASGLETLRTYRDDGEGGELNLYLLLTTGGARPLAAAADG